jgi:hypothetical protein
VTPNERTPERDWFKSSRSSNNAACVEVRFMGEAVAVRDSKDRGGPVLDFTSQAWSEFIASLRADR